MPHTKKRLEQIQHASSAVRAEIDAEIEKVLSERPDLTARADTQDQQPRGRNEPGSA